MTTAAAQAIGPGDLPLLLTVAAGAFLVAMFAARWVGRRMVRGLNRAVHAARVAAWRRRDARWVAQQDGPVASTELLITINKLIAAGR